MAAQHVDQHGAAGVGQGADDGLHMVVLAAHIRFDARAHFGQRVDGRCSCGWPHRAPSSCRRPPRPTAAGRRAARRRCVSDGIRQLARKRGAQQRSMRAQASRDGWPRRPAGRRTCGSRRRCATAALCIASSTVAGRGLGGRAGAAGTDAYLGGIEHVHQFAAGQAGHGKVQRGRQRFVEGIVEHHAGQGGAQAVGQTGRGKVSSCSWPRKVSPRSSAASTTAQRGDAGHVLGCRSAGRPPGRPPMIQRRERRAGAHVQHADAFWRVQLVAENGA